MMADNKQMVSLTEWDWNGGLEGTGGYVQVEYPAELIVDFIDKIRERKQWRESPDPGRSVFDMFQYMQTRLMDYRNAQATAKAREGQLAAEPEIDIEPKKKGKGWRKRAREALSK